MSLRQILFADPNAGVDSTNPKTWEKVEENLDEGRPNIEKTPGEMRMKFKYIPFKNVPKKTEPKATGPDPSTARKFNTTQDLGGDPATVAVGPRGQRSASSREYYYAPGEPGLTRAGLSAASFAVPYKEDVDNQLPQDPPGFDTRESDSNFSEKTRPRISRRRDADVNVDFLQNDKSYKSGMPSPQDAADIGMGNVLWPLASLRVDKDLRLNPVVFTAGLEYPLASKSEMQAFAGDLGWKGDIFWTSPEQFLECAGSSGFGDPEVGEGQQVPGGVETLKAKMEARTPLDPLVLIVDWEKGQVTGHEGRHRAQAAIELGITSVPVLVILRGAWRVPAGERMSWTPEMRDKIAKFDFKPQVFANLIAHVRKRGNKWVVTNKAGDKTLGTHDTEADARKQLAAIEINKHVRGVRADIDNLVEIELGCANADTLGLKKAKERKAGWDRWNETHEEKIRIKDPEPDCWEGGYFYKEGSLFTTEGRAGSLVDELKAAGIDVDIIHKGWDQVKAAIDIGKHVRGGIKSAGGGMINFLISPSGEFISGDYGEHNSIANNYVETHGLVQEKLNWLKENPVPSGENESIWEVESAINMLFDDGWVRGGSDYGGSNAGILFLHNPRRNFDVESVLKNIPQELLFVSNLSIDNSGKDEQIPVMYGEEDALDAWKHRNDIRHRVKAGKGVLKSGWVSNTGKLDFLSFDDDGEETDMHVDYLANNGMDFSDAFASGYTRFRAHGDELILEAGSKEAITSALKHMEEFTSSHGFKTILAEIEGVEFSAYIEDDETALDAWEARGHRVKAILYKTIKFWMDSAGAIVWQGSNADEHGDNLPEKFWEDDLDQRRDEAMSIAISTGWVRGTSGGGVLTLDLNSTDRVETVLKSLPQEWLFVHSLLVDESGGGRYRPDKTISVDVGEDEDALDAWRHRNDVRHRIKASEDLNSLSDDELMKRLPAKARVEVAVLPKEQKRAFALKKLAEGTATTPKEAPKAPEAQKQAPAEASVPAKPATPKVAEPAAPERRQGHPQTVADPKDFNWYYGRPTFKSQSAPSGVPSYEFTLDVEAEPKTAKGDDPLPRELAGTLTFWLKEKREKIVLDKGLYSFLPAFPAYKEVGEYVFDNLPSRIVDAAEDLVEKENVRKDEKWGGRNYNVLEDPALNDLNPPITPMEKLFTTIPAWTGDSFFADTKQIDKATLRLLKQTPKSPEGTKYFNWLFMPKERSAEINKWLLEKEGYTMETDDDALMVSRLDAWKRQEADVKKRRETQ